MKKTHLILALTLTATLLFSTIVDTEAKSPRPHMEEDSKKGEESFIKHADESLAIMEQAALKMEVKGVAVVAYIPDNPAKSWISKMKVVSALTSENASFLAIAYSKASEMADTFQDSGTTDRKPLSGEFGYQGGVIKKTDSGHILAVFSGATGEQDTAIAREGIERLTVEK